ncbi:coiled-coil domain-containing protein 138 isoform X2 [Kryptolebias marmoratus]|uniref:Coiled-coil domain containing 138 n=1 Tax=Kryptolebias marmoratus TaxID=37003 RepID=A0A3Q2ZCU0_KRYMA|nr:coiled-coil domain-containing protein 138 isoform X2 [Kryptolebias marmoratus]
MEQRFSSTAEILTQKYLERRKQGPHSEDNSGASDEAQQRIILAHRPKQPKNELRIYHEALHELFKAVTEHPDQFDSDCSLHRSNSDLSLTSTEEPLQDSQVLFTETDVTLPSHLGGSFEFQEMDKHRELKWAGRCPDSRDSSSSFVKVYQEMMSVYAQLKAERNGQQQWERELQERERRLKRREEAFEGLAGAEDMKRQQELSQLQDLLREKSKENKRFKSNFSTIKELNDNMRKQLNELSEQNRKLETQSKRLQARLENLQKKYEHCTTLRGCQKGSVNRAECIKPHIKEKTAECGKSSNKASSLPIQLKLLEHLLEWVLDGQMFSSVAGNEVNPLGQCLPPEVLLNEKCLKVLPLLSDQLRSTPLSEPTLLLSLLRFIHWALRHLDSRTQRVSPSATLRRIGEAVLKLSAQSTALQSRNPDLPVSSIDTTAPFRSLPFPPSPCSHTLILSNLIILRTITQADVLAQAADSLCAELKREESRGLYIHYGGVHVLLSVLRSNPVSLHTPIELLMQLTEPSRYLNSFLEACSCEEFFRTASQLLKNPHMELPSLEKFSILLQKLSSIRKNRSLFERSSLHLQLQDLYRTDPERTFLHLNIRSILHNLK